jgi:hypothetical protein
MIGQRHLFADGYSFVETLCGPMVHGQCVDCEARPMVVAAPFDRDLATPVRCNNCARRHHGLAHLTHVTPSTLTDGAGAAGCRFVRGSLYCVAWPCGNPGHRRSAFEGSTS